MTEYLLVNHGVGSPENWEEFFQMLIDGGHMIGGSALGEGISVSGDVFAGPVSRTITGYIVIQAESLDRAKEIARLCPVHQAGGTVELFPLEKS